MSGFLLDTNCISEVELQARFSGRILPIDAAVADRWGACRRSQAQREDPYRLLTACWPRLRFTIILRSFHET